MTMTKDAWIREAARWREVARELAGFLPKDPRP
jgi:hypothetical protein